MKHITTLNGIVSYELVPETDDDRHIIEIMKSKGSVTMRQSKNGGIIFDLEKKPGLPAMAQSEGSPVNLNDIPGRGEQ